MHTVDRLRRSGVGIEPDRTIQEAATVMEQAGVGALAVIDGEVLVGIVTDRDLVRRALARGLPADARVDAVMSTPVVTVDADEDLRAAFELFGAHPMRRLPVMREGRFLGMITVDDLLIDVASNLADLTRPVAAELLWGHHEAGLPVRI